MRYRLQISEYTLSKIEKMPMTERSVLEKLETLTATITRLEQRVEDLEDLRDLEVAVVENAGKPLLSWEAAKKRLELD